MKTETKSYSGWQRKRAFDSWTASRGVISFLVHFLKYGKELSKGGSWGYLVLTPVQFLGGLCPI